MILPALLTAPAVAAKLPLPAMKSLSAISADEATKPRPTFTTPVLVMAIPLGLMRNTLPVASISPAMVEAVVPVTRDSVALLASGCTKTTLSPAATLKLFQLITAFALVCVMVTLPLVDAPMVALPATTVPPVGKAGAAA